MYRTALEPPQGVWWKPAGPTEKIWVTIAFAWCLVLFAMMPLWHLRGAQNPSGIRHRVDARAYSARVYEFTQQYQVGTENGVPLVEPPPGSHVYLQASMWAWTPVLRLREGAEYTLHLSSIDVNHGFSLFPLNVNFQVVPGYDYGLVVTPNSAGEFEIICNEFCGVGHHLMVGKVIVLPKEGAERADSSQEERLASQEERLASQEERLASQEERLASQEERLAAAGEGLR